MDDFYCPDPDEISENRIERLMDERCLPHDMYRCPGCEKVVRLDSCEALSPDPYAAPYCQECLEHSQ